MRLGAFYYFLSANQPVVQIHDPVCLVGDLGIDAIISPRLLSVSLALHFARKGRIRSVAALLEDSVEVFEVEAAARQYVRKVSGVRKPSRGNQATFDQAVSEVAHATLVMLESLGK